MRTQHYLIGLLAASCAMPGLTCVPMDPKQPGLPDDSERPVIPDAGGDTCPPSSDWGSFTRAASFGGNTDRLIFVQATWEQTYCGGEFPARRLANGRMVMVESATLASTEISYVGDLRLHTDGEWVVFPAANGIGLYDIDAGSSQLVYPDTYPAAKPGRVDRPYVVIGAYSGDVVLNGENGEILELADGDSTYAKLTDVSGHRAAYVEIDDHSNSVLPSPVSGRLMLRDLESGVSTFLADVQDVDALWLLPDRVVWTEYIGPPFPGRRPLRFYECASGTVTTLMEVPATDSRPLFEMLGVIEAGVVVLRNSNWPDFIDSLELTGFDGQSRLIGTYASGELEDSDIQAAGPFVLFRRAGQWNIFDARDNTCRQVNPFAVGG